VKTSLRNVEVAERTWGYRDWLHRFATWRNDTITKLKAAYEGEDIALEFEAVGYYGTLVPAIQVRV
jgi:hypothetical protein